VICDVDADVVLVQAEAESSSGIGGVVGVGAGCDGSIEEDEMPGVDWRTESCTGTNFFARLAFGLLGISGIDAAFAVAVAVAFALALVFLAGCDACTSTASDSGRGFFRGRPRFFATTSDDILVMFSVCN
jgi:hypothetical protein